MRILNIPFAAARQSNKKEYFSKTVFSGTAGDSVQIAKDPIIVDTSTLAEAEQFKRAEEIQKEGLKEGLSKIETNRFLEQEQKILRQIFENPSCEEALFEAGCRLVRIAGQQGNMLEECDITVRAGFDKYFDSVLIISELQDRILNPRRKQHLQGRRDFILREIIKRPY